MYGAFTYPPRMGGSVHGYHLARGLTNRKHKLYTWYYGNEDYPYCKHFRGREVLRFLRTIDVLYVRVELPNLLEHINLLRLLLYTRVPTALEFNALPSEILFHPGARLNQNKIADRLRRLAGRGDVAIGVSESIRRYLHEEIGFQKTYCIPNGSDPEIFKPAKKNLSTQKALQAVWIGSTESSWHNLDSIMRAAQILHDRSANIVFRIYGDATFLPSPLPPNVRACGIVQYEKIGATIGDAHVGLHIMRPNADALGGKDGLALKVFDYMACGLALVKQIDGQNLIKKWGSGVITTGDPEDIADKLQFLEKDRNLCMQLGANGRRAVTEYYNWDRAVRETETVLLEVAGDRYLCRRDK